MQEKVFIHLNCLSIIPGCGFRCEKCINEIRSVLKAKEGVSEVVMTELDYISAISIDYDPDVISIDEITSILGRLPSFYSIKFDFQQIA